jgi:hypothetical protein
VQASSRENFSPLFKLFQLDFLVPKSFFYDIFFHKSISSFSIISPSSGIQSREQFTTQLYCCVLLTLLIQKA